MTPWGQYTFGDAFPILEAIEDESIDLIFTSLPDMSQTPFGGDGVNDITAYLSLQFGALSQFSRIIKPTGFVVLCQTDRKVNGEILCNHVNYINWLHTRFHMKVKDEKIVVRNSVGKRDLYYMTYQYMTVFTRKGTWKRAGDFLKDIIVDPQREIVPGQYSWSIDFCRLVIENLTKPGDKVIDPFAAAGPVLYAAGLTGRQWWGAECDPVRYNTGLSGFDYVLPC